MTSRRLLFVAAVAASLVSCSDSALTPNPSAKHVLFIGNSLTRANDLPGTMAGIAALTGVSISVGDESRGGVALIDYFYDDGAALRAIDQGSWDFVVLQQGPTWPGLCRDTLVLATTMFADRIRAKGGSPALMMPWASTAEMQYLDGVRTAYGEAAATANAMLIPVGDAWKIALDGDPTLPLYDSDGYHPAPLGTYLSALVVYEKLTGGDARQLPLTVIVHGDHFEVSEDTIRLLQNAAHAANVAGAVRAGGRANAIGATTC